MNDDTCLIAALGAEKQGFSLAPCDTVLSLADRGFLERGDPSSGFKSGYVLTSEGRRHALALESQHGPATVTLGGEPFQPTVRPYQAIQDDMPCAHCGKGETFSVIGPDGCLQGVSYDDLTDAEELAEALNAAYEAGKSAVKP